MRVTLLITCFNDTMVPGTGRSVVSVLERLGHTVEFPHEQSCCGQMHLNVGYRPDARLLVQRFVQMFAQCDFVVTPSAACAGMIRANHPVLAERYGSADLHREVTELAGRVHEFSEFLTAVLGVTDVGAAFPHRVAYSPTCQVSDGPRLGEPPLRLLRAVKDIELVDLPAAGSCCGLGSTAAADDRETPAAMLADKVAAVLRTEAEVLCGADDTCLMHIGDGLYRQGSRVRTMHLAEILAATEGADG
ncbi:(Fe-S)-binding protein [Yinghuangia seranimata]|uniref:(Fe-S)-binding protein n=1 Tax=Yinghuangia seranimata TaxID=408067 RepID=UPI00248AAD67|nr:(Fe-S)-binding protein [Yinghuangia seranimata]MDI2129497.1 (Fe-S)-binding protein [Yinghuangia seranimata]